MLPVGSSAPVLRPAGDTKPTSTLTPVAAWPGMRSSPSNGTTPPGVATRATRVEAVFSLYIHTSVTSPCGATIPRWRAYRPTADAQLPQLEPNSTSASAMPTCANRYDRSAGPCGVAVMIAAFEVVEVAPPTPLI